MWHHQNASIDMNLDYEIGNKDKSQRLNLKHNFLSLLFSAAHLFPPEKTKSRDIKGEIVK